MKPTSIIFLVVALLFGIGGYACMRIGQSKAAAEGIDILAGTAVSDEDLVFEYEYDEDTIGKLSINVKDADVNIIGGSSRAYIELVNFPEGMYEFSSSNRILTVSNNSDLSQITDMASLIFNFKGLRSLVNYYNVRERERTINIYVTDELPINIFECKLENGDVYISDNSSTSDYNITIANGDLTLKNITTASTASLSVGNGELTLDSCIIYSLTIKQEKGRSELITSTATRLNAELSDGDFRFGYRNNLEFINMDLFTEKGSVRIDSTDVGGFYEVTDLPNDSKFEVKVKNGDIVMNSNMLPEDGLN